MKMIDGSTTIGEAVRFIRQNEDVGIVQMVGRKSDDTPNWMVLIVADEDAVRLEQILKDAQFGNEPGR